MILFFSKKTGKCIGSIFGRIHTDKEKEVTIQTHDHTTDDIEEIVNEWVEIGRDEKGNAVLAPEWGDPVFWKEIEEGTKHIQDLSLVTVDGVKGIQYTPPIDNQATKEVE